MAAIVLAVVAGICALGWLTRYISTAVLLWYLQEKNIPFPSEEDMRSGAKWVVSHVVRDLFCRKNRR